MKMTKKLYLYRMKLYEKQFDKLWMKIVNDTNKYLKDNPESEVDIDAEYSWSQIEHFKDHMALSAAWIYDRLHRYKYRARRGLTRKIRIVLGYTIP